MCRIHTWPREHPLAVHDMGTTQHTRAEFLAFLAQISPRFTMYTYNLLENNCNNFSDEVWKGVSFGQFYLNDL